MTFRILGAICFSLFFIMACFGTLLVFQSPLSIPKVLGAMYAWVAVTSYQDARELILNLLPKSFCAWRGHKPIADYDSYTDYANNEIAPGVYCKRCRARGAIKLRHSRPFGCPWKLPVPYKIHWAPPPATLPAMKPTPPV